MDFRELMSLWGSKVRLATELGEKPGTVQQWWNRNDIPPEKYPDILQAIRRLIDAGDKRPLLKSLDYEVLFAMGRRARDRRRRGGDRAAQRSKAQDKKRTKTKGARAELEPCA